MVVSKVMRGSEKTVHTQFVLRGKTNENKELIKDKARLVICGNEQQELVEERFRPVSDFTLTNVVMCFSNQKDWHAGLLDFQNAFPHGRLDRAVYAELWIRIYDDDKQAAHGVRLHQSMYELKDTPKIWYEHIASGLEKAGLKKMKSSLCMFRNIEAVVVCYVDDLLVFTNNMVYFEYLKGHLKMELNMKDLGEPKQFLGMESNWKNDKMITLKQLDLITKKRPDTHGKLGLSKS